MWAFCFLFLQDILKNILFIYQLDYPVPEYPFLSAGYNDLSPGRSQDKNTRASLRLLWDGHSNNLPGRSKKYASAGDRNQNSGYRASVTDIVEQYLALLEELEESRANSLQHRFKDYYARYAELLERYNKYKDEGLSPSEVDEGYQRQPPDELGVKMNLIKDYLKKVYAEKFGDNGDFVDGAWIGEDKPWEDAEGDEGDNVVAGNGDSMREDLVAWLEDTSSSSSSVDDDDDTQVLDGSTPVG